MSEEQNSISPSGANPSEIRSTILNDAAYLHKGYTKKYNWIYDDSGTGADSDINVYRPVLEDDCFFVGDYAQENRDTPVGTSLLVRAYNDNPETPLLVEPSGYTRIWYDIGSGGKYDGSFWWPIAPKGYVALGGVCWQGHELRGVEGYRCVRADLVKPSTVGELIWTDKGSGVMKGDLSVFRNAGVKGAFLLTNSYDKGQVPPSFQLK